MVSEKDVTCPLHNGLDEKVSELFRKHDKLYDKVTLILIIQIMTAFFSGGDLIIKVIAYLGKVPK